MDLWSKTKYFQGAEDFLFRDLGRSMHLIINYFKGARPGGLCIPTKGCTHNPKNQPSMKHLRRFELQPRSTRLSASPVKQTYPDH